MQSNPPAISTLASHYPNITPACPLLSCAPMRLISTPTLASTVSLAGGLGFLGAGSDISTLSTMLSSSSDLLQQRSFSNGYTWDPTVDAMPIGVGFLLWGISDAHFADVVIPELKKWKPVAVWLFAPRGRVGGGEKEGEREEWIAQLRLWISSLRQEIPNMKIWLQIGSVAQATVALEDEVLGKEIDVLVVQGADAGGHGLTHGAGLISLVPEVVDGVGEICAKRARDVPAVIATGGLSTGRQVASTIMLGAQGACLGTRFLACPEAEVAHGYRDEVVRATDGGQSTVRSGVYDYLRGTRAWPPGIGGRGVANKTYEDWMAAGLGVGSGSGVHDIAHGNVEDALQKQRDELQKQYKHAEKNAYNDKSESWGPQGLMTTYAGTSVGLVKKIVPAEQIVKEVQQECLQVLGKLDLDAKL